MRAAAVGLLAALAAATSAAAEDTVARLGIMGGASLLEHKDTSLTHATLTDEVTLGRSVLGGLALEVAFGGERVALEGSIGPYHSDVDRSCITRQPEDPRCTPVPTNSTSHVVFYGMHYRHVFGDGGWRPALGVGVGAKRYTFGDDIFKRSETSPTLEGSIGVESTGRTAVRVEARGIRVLDNPLLVDKAQFELQVRASVFIPFGR